MGSRGIIRGKATNGGPHAVTGYRFTDRAFLQMPALRLIVRFHLDQKIKVLMVEVCWPRDLAVQGPLSQSECNAHDHCEPRHWRHLDCMEY